MNPDLELLQPYPFQRLRALFAGIEPSTSRRHINLGIGEPRHPTPRCVVDALIAGIDGLGRYPATRGLDTLRNAMAGWIRRRYHLPETGVDPVRHVLPVAGTREALFAIAQLLVDRRQQPLVLMPNPFYQIYEGATLLAGAEPRYLPCSAATGYLPDPHDVTDRDWRRCQLLYVCSPANPSGAVLPKAQQLHLLELADRHDFVIAADECYSEIYPPGTPPPQGFLQTAHDAGRADFQRLLVFHSLSKRSNAPGLRSGFVAGDPDLLERFLLYRTYQGCALPEPTQAASIAAWNDERHVEDNRRHYQAKFDAVLEILGDRLNVTRPEAGFYLWPRTPIGDEAFARELYRREGVTVLPGSYLSRAAGGSNPGAGHVRMALVPPLEECREAAWRIRRLLASLPPG